MPLETLALLSVAILVIAFWIVKYSFSVGNTRMPSRAPKPTTMAQNISPNSVTPRCRAAV